MTLKKKTLKLASATGQNWQLANKKIIFEHQRYYDGFWVILGCWVRKWHPLLWIGLVFERSISCFFEKRKITTFNICHKRTQVSVTLEMSLTLHAMHSLFATRYTNTVCVIVVAASRYFSNKVFQIPFPAAQVI